MDIIIMVLIVVTAFLVTRSNNRVLVVSLWVVTLIAMLALFRYHTTDPLDLSF